MKNPGKNRIKIKERMDLAMIKNKFVETMFVNRIIQTTKTTVNGNWPGNDFFKDFIL